jgi:hypothetical protein
MFKFIIIDTNKTKAPDLMVADLEAMCAKARERAADPRVATFHVAGPGGVIGPEALRVHPPRAWRATGAQAAGLVPQMPTARKNPASARRGSKSGRPWVGR